jgi:hypothetical protein
MYYQQAPPPMPEKKKKSRGCLIGWYVLEQSAHAELEGILTDDWRFIVLRLFAVVGCVERLVSAVWIAWNLCFVDARIVVMIVVEQSVLEKHDLAFDDGYGLNLRYRRKPNNLLASVYVECDSNW